MSSLTVRYVRSCKLNNGLTIDKLLLDSRLVQQLKRHFLRDATANRKNSVRQKPLDQVKKSSLCHVLFVCCGFGSSATNSRHTAWLQHHSWTDSLMEMTENRRDRDVHFAGLELQLLVWGQLLFVLVFLLSAANGWHCFDKLGYDRKICYQCDDGKFNSSRCSRHFQEYYAQWRWSYTSVKICWSHMILNTCRSE